MKLPAVVSLSRKQAIRGVDRLRFLAEPFIYQTYKKMIWSSARLLVLLLFEFFHLVSLLHKYPAHVAKYQPASGGYILANFALSVC